MVHITSLFNLRTKVPTLNSSVSKVRNTLKILEVVHLQQKLLDAHVPNNFRYL